MVYVALLRGINVGGKSRVEMRILKSVVESIGCMDVTTYINSGNVLFADDRPLGVLEQLLFEAIQKQFGFIVPVQLRSQPEMQALVRKIPKKWTNDTILKTDVLFLEMAISGEAILKHIKVNPLIIERTLLTKRELIWNIARKDINRGNSIKLVGTDVYKHLTIRNVNTVLKLYSMMVARATKD